MADRLDINNQAPASGSLDISGLEGDISRIEGEYEPRIEKQEQEAESLEGKAVAASEQVATEAERQATEASAPDQEMEQWLASTPTRQAAYATSMHAAPALAILTALGGKLTRLNGLQMLSATNGIVQGLNEASEKKYNDALESWKAAYTKMREHQQRLMDAHRLMLTAYQGRADAYQKAADAARRMTGDILDDKQRQISQKIDTFKAQAAALDKIARVNLAREQLHARIGHMIAQEAHWKELEKKSAAMPPEIKVQLAQEQARWRNAKSQIDENMKRRGQINSNLDLPADAKAASLDRIDAEDEALTMEMNKAESNADAIIAGFVARGPAPPKPTGPRPGQHGASGTWDTPEDRAALPPEAKQQLEANKGKAVTFGNNQTWIMDQDGQVKRVQ